MAARATVILPTFGPARFAGWAIRSVRNQTVRNLEICVICDGSPADMVGFFQAMAREDPRMKVFVFPKSPRTGEPYRDAVIRQTTGRIICYCSHDDLWLPNHVAEMEVVLKKCRFAHSLHAAVSLPEKVRAGKGLFQRICLDDLQRRATVKGMFEGVNCFGLTYGAHTRDSYFQLQEGWVTTPEPEVPTDLYMWCKFLTAFPRECRTLRKVTAINFPYVPRKTWTQEQRDQELKQYFDRIQDPAFAKVLSRSLLACRISAGWRSISDLATARRLRRSLRERWRTGAPG